MREPARCPPSADRPARAASVGTDAAPPVAASGRSSRRRPRFGSDRRGGLDRDLTVEQSLTDLSIALEKASEDLRACRKTIDQARNDIATRSNSISRDVITAVPDAQREAMLALGATRWEMITKAVLPYARSGIIGAVILGLGRALGETMAVTMVIGNTSQLPQTVFQSSQTIASQIATT